jgi:hypothetical protein
MTTLQEISVHTTGSVLQIVLLSMRTDAGEPYFLAEVLYRLPEFSPFSNVYSFSTPYSDPASAFKDAFVWTQGFVKKRGEAIIVIDNPCNCPFLSKLIQQAIVSAAGVNVPVLENGK